MIIKKNRLHKKTELTDMGTVREEFSEPVDDVNKFESSNNLVDSMIQEQSSPESDIDLFNLDNIDFSQRTERRQGNRRRGFRRVDDRNLVSRAKDEADSIREAARKEGYQQGLSEARADLAEMRTALSEFMRAKQEVFEYIAPDILEISVDIAKKIIKKEVEQDPQILFDTIVDVLKTLSKEETKITVRVSPTQANVVKSAVPHIADIAGIEAKITVLPDDEVEEGGCLVTTNNGIVDATVRSRVAVVVEALKEL